MSRRAFVICCSPCFLLLLLIFCVSVFKGLGKTVQCVALFEHLRRVEHLPGPFLVVVPLGTISHWKREFEAWTDMSALIHTHHATSSHARKPDLITHCNCSSLLHALCLSVLSLRNALVYHDAVRGKETRRLIRETEFFYGNSKQVKFNVLITTYEVLIGDVEELSAVPWMQVIVDEGPLTRIAAESCKLALDCAVSHAISDAAVLL